MEHNEPKERKERKETKELAPQGRPGGGIRPPLTGTNATEVVNAILARRGGTDAQGAHIKRDWRGFVRSQFRLTPVQERNLDNIPPVEVARIQQAAILAVDQGGAIHLHLGADGGAQQGSLTVTPQASGASPSAPESLNINILKIDCTFDTDCSHWHCTATVPGF